MTDESRMEQSRTTENVQPQPTWRDIAVAFPTGVQEYVQKVGPLPDGPITQEAWDAFREWCLQTANGDKA